MSMILTTGNELMAALDAIAPADASGQRNQEAMDTVVYFGRSSGPYGYGLYVYAYDDAAEIHAFLDVPDDIKR